MRGRRTGLGILTAECEQGPEAWVFNRETGQQDRDTIVKWAELASQGNAAQVGDGERLVPLRRAAELKAGRGALYFPLPLGADVSAWVYVGLEHARELRFPEIQAEPVPENWVETLSVLAAIFCLQAAPSRIQPSGRHMLGSCPAMLEVFEAVARVGPTEANVLICGETGTGKELVARSLHEASSRRSGPFVALNCAGLDGDTLRSELFGHERGAFTGADRKALGKFREANGGTCFLDEIGDMPLETQQRLLRALQERRVTPVGGNRGGIRRATGLCDEQGPRGAGPRGHLSRRFPPPHQHRPNHATPAQGSRKRRRPRARSRRARNHWAAAKSARRMVSPKRLLEPCAPIPGRATCANFGTPFTADS